MFETIYLTSVEKREFFNEFVEALLIAVKRGQEATKEAKEKKLGEEEKAGLIVRQFPGLTRIGAPLPQKVVEIKSKEQFLVSNDKIDSLLKDSGIKIIECSEGIVRISRGQGLEETGFRLNEHEIKMIIEKFSEKAKVPIVGNIFKAVADNTAITAITSDVVGSRFLIIKG